MERKYIRKNKNSYAIYKNSTGYGKFNSLDDAIFIRDILVENNWDLNSIDEIIRFQDNYCVVKVIDDKVCILAKFKSPPSDETVERLVKKQIRNPNNSRYGLNITKVFDTFIIKKQIAGEEIIFGYYDNIADAEFARNFLMDHMWNVNEFSHVNFDEDSQNYKIVEVIDDKAYVIDTYGAEEEIDLDSSREKFLTEITKHKSGLASHPHLDELADRIPELEDDFGVRAKDDVWSFEKAEDPLNGIIFSLSPWQKIVYDAVEDSTFDDIQRSLVAYRSGNFSQKIRRNLDELVTLGLIFEDEGTYKKIDR